MGYPIIIHSFLIELKKRNISNFPYEFKKSIMSITLNERLLNVEIIIIYKKTNLYDSFAVYHCFDLIKNILKILLEKEV